MLSVPEGPSPADSGLWGDLLSMPEVGVEVAGAFVLG